MEIYKSTSHGCTTSLNFISISFSPGNTPAKPSARSMSSSTGNEAIESSLCCPSSDDDGYIFVPIPKRRPVSFAIASWSPAKLHCDSMRKIPALCFKPNYTNNPTLYTGLCLWQQMHSSKSHYSSDTIPKHEFCKRVP